MSTPTIHHTPSNDYGKTPATTCKATLATDRNSTTNPEDVTCKRCLKALAGAKPVGFDADTTVTLNELLDELLGDHEEYTGTPTGLDDEDTDWPESPEAPSTPEEPTMDDIRTAQGKLNDRSASAKAAIKEGRRLVAGGKAPKTTKVPTVHLHDAGRSSHGTWCKIPGQYSTDPAEVTCKVCRAHIDGTKPLNAIDDRVKKARKSFRSFVARVGYMVYMDSDCSLSGSWSLKHTNMAGTEYEVNSFEGCKVNGEVVCSPIGKDIKQWMERNWSCGEEV